MNAQRQTQEQAEERIGQAIESLRYAGEYDLGRLAHAVQAERERRLNVARLAEQRRQDRADRQRQRQKERQRQERPATDAQDDDGPLNLVG